MISFLAKHKNVILAVVIISFLGGMGYGGFAALTDSRSPSGVVAQVGNEKIRAGKYNLMLRLQEEQFKRLGADLEAEQLQNLKNQVLFGLIYESMIVQSAKKFGLNVSDYEIAFNIRTSPMFSQGGWFDKQAYVYTVRNQLFMNPEEYENQERRSLLRYKMMMMLASAYKTSPQEIKENYRDQYNGNMKKFEENKEDFAATIVERKTNEVITSFEKSFNSKNEVKVVLPE